MSKELSDVDKKILRAIITPPAKIPSQLLAKKVGIPLSTLRRRRNRLERDYLTAHYTLNMERFGWRASKLYISTHGGKTQDVAKKLFDREDVVYAARTLGQHTIDLDLEVFTENDNELVNMIEEVKAMPGVKDLMWTRIVKIFDRKGPPPFVFNQILQG